MLLEAIGSEPKRLLDDALPAARFRSGFELVAVEVAIARSHVDSQDARVFTSLRIEDVLNHDPRGSIEVLFKHELKGSGLLVSAQVSLSLSLCKFRQILDWKVQGF